MSTFPINHRDKSLVGYGCPRLVLVQTKQARSTASEQTSLKDFWQLHFGHGTVSTENLTITLVSSRASIALRRLEKRTSAHEVRVK